MTNQSKELIIPEVIEPRACFLGVDGNEPTVKEIVDGVKNKVGDFKGNVSTEKGRKKIASLAYKIARSKTAIDSIAKGLKDEMSKDAKVVQSNRNYATGELQAMQDRVRAPLTEWEENEKRITKEKQDNFARLQAASTVLLEDLSLIEQELEFVENLLIDTDTIEEKKIGLAVELQEKAIAHLEQRTEKIKKDIADREELERYKAQKAKEEEEKRIEEMVQKRVEEAQKKQPAPQMESQCQRPVEQVSGLAQREAEEQNQKQELKQGNENKEHQRAVNRQILQSLLDLGIEGMDAKRVVEAMAQGQIPNVSINY